MRNLRMAKARVESGIFHDSGRMSGGINDLQPEISANFIKLHEVIGCHWQNLDVERYQLSGLLQLCAQSISTTASDSVQGGC